MINSEDDDFTQIIKESINRNPEDNSFAIQVNGVTHVFLKSDIPAMIEAVEDIEYEAFWGKPKKKKKSPKPPAIKQVETGKRRN